MRDGSLLMLASAVGDGICCWADGVLVVSTFHAAGYAAGQVVSLPQHLHSADEHTEHAHRPQLLQPSQPRGSTALHQRQDCVQQVCVYPWAAAFIVVCDFVMHGCNYGAGWLCLWS